MARIGDRAFHNCNGLTSVTIPSSVASIGDYAFYGCSGLTSVTIPSGVTSIGECAFEGCSGLTSVEIPSGIKAIGFCAFGDCSLTSVTIPSGVIDRGAFACWTLTSATILRSVESVGTYAFGEENMLTSLKVYGGRIEEQAFINSYALTAANLYDGVTSLGEYAFYGSTELTSVMIPSSVTAIGRDAFSDCNKLTTIYVSSGDIQRVKNMLSGSGMDVAKLKFIETDTSGEGTDGEGDDEDCGGDCSPADEGDEGSGVGVKDPFDGNEKHVFNGLVRDKKKSPCGLIQVTTAKATKKGVKVSGFVMLEDGKKVTMKAVTVAVEKKQLNVSTTVGKLGSISLTIGGNGFAGTLGDKKVASEKLDEDAGVLKTTVKVTYLDAATGKLKTKNMTLGGITVGGDAAGTLSQKNSSTRAFQAETECDSCRPN